MASPADIQRELARRRIQETLEARRADMRERLGVGDNPGFIPGGYAQGREIAQHQMELEAQAMDRAGQLRGRDVAPAVGEMIGATGGAALGTMVGGFPGAVAGGAGGARLGRVAGQALVGEEELDPGFAGLIGAAGPLAGKIVQTASRLFAGLPTVRGAQRASDLAARQKTARETVAKAPERRAQLETEIAKDAEQLKRAEAIMAESKTLSEASPMVRVLNATLRQETARLGLLVKNNKTVREELLRSDPVKTAAAQVTAGEASGWGFATVGGGAVGAMAGDPVSGGLTGAAIGFVLQRMRGPIAEHLASNPNFVRWATGLDGQSATAALSTFITEVVAQAESEQDLDALSAFSDMMERVADQPLPSFIGEAEGAELVPGSVRPARDLEAAQGSIPPRGTQITPGSIRPAAPGGSGAPQHVKDRLGTLGADRDNPRNLPPELQRRPGVVDPQPFRPEFSRGVRRAEDGRGQR